MAGFVFDTNTSPDPDVCGSLCRTTRAAILFALLPNAVFWVMGYWFDLGRPVFNLDYFFVGVCFAAGSIYLGIVLVVLLFLIDVLVLVGQIYPFLRIHDLVYLAGLLPEAPGFFQLVVVSALLYLGGMAAFMARRGSRVGILSTLIPLNMALLFYGLHVYGGADSTEKMWRAQQGTIVESQSINFLEHRMGGFVDSFSLVGEPFVKAGYYGRTAKWASTPVVELNPKLLLVVAESWGRFEDDEVQRAIINPVLARRSRFEWIDQGELSFIGATVAGELRELCGLKPNHFNLKDVEAGFESCLPRRLREGGYKTAAVHGAVGLMYDRLHWYPRAGFEEVHFLETDSWESRCYSFPGVCDKEIAQDFVRHVFSGKERRFVYWLTLNSHSIYDERDLHGKFFDCAEHEIPLDSSMCRMAQLHAQFFHDLAEIVDDQSMHGVEVLVVGDHMPPLVNGGGSEVGIKEDTVSWLHFKVGAGNVDFARVVSH